MGRHAAAVPAVPAVPASPAEEAPPVGADVRVVSGDPTPEELAAVVAVLQRQADEAASLGRPEVIVSPRTGWDVSARGLRRPLEHGAGAWARSLR